MTYFDGKKTVDDLEFHYIRIWVLVMKMPLGMMSKTYAQVTWYIIGYFMAMEVDEGNIVIGQLLCIKVKLDILEPLMRGVTLYVEEGVEEEEEKEWAVWCGVLWCTISFRSLLHMRDHRAHG